MTKDRSDLLNLCIGLIELKFEVTNYEELYTLLDTQFGHMKFSMDEIVEYYSLSTEIEDKYLILKNTNSEG